MRNELKNTERTVWYRVFGIPKYRMSPSQFCILPFFYKGAIVDYVDNNTSVFFQLKDSEIFNVVMDPSKGVDNRAIAQAVSRWLPTAAARVRSRIWSSGICGGQNGAGAGFLRV
jgi:hypothetical protein